MSRETGECPLTNGQHVEEQVATQPGTRERSVLMTGRVLAVSFALFPSLQMELPDTGSGVGFLVSGIVTLVAIAVVLAVLIYLVRRAWRPIADAVRYDRSEDE